MVRVRVGDWRSIILSVSRFLFIKKGCNFEILTKPEERFNF